MINTLFRDALLIMLTVLVACIAFMIRYMADPTTKTGDISSPGSIIVSASWDPGDDDVDLWLMGPGETTPVYYGNKAGNVWDLLRDDLGDLGDPTPLNYENGFTRGEPPGEYTIDVLCYRCSAVMPIDVTVEVQETQKDGKLKVISTTDVKMKFDGQESTAADFIVGPDGKIDPTTINTSYRNLSSMKKKSPE